MPNDDSRILTTHVGGLVRPQEIIDLMRAKLQALTEGAALASKQLWPK